MEFMDDIKSACVAVSIIFWITAALFAVLKEKGAILVNYNMAGRILPGSTSG